MKRGDFKNITEEHFEICERLSVNDGNCRDISCFKCPFNYGNSIYNKGCLDSKYKIKNGVYHKDEELVKSAKEFLKLREEKNMKDIFMYNGKIYEVIYENAGSMLSTPINCHEYIRKALSVCEQEESGFFIRKDPRGLYYCEPYIQEYNTTEKILCCNDGYRIESVLAVLNNLCPDFKEFVKIVNEL